MAAAQTRLLRKEARSLPTSITKLQEHAESQMKKREEKRKEKKKEMPSCSPWWALR
jgi:hypothetical protein